MVVLREAGGAPSRGGPSTPAACSAFLCPAMEKYEVQCIKEKQANEALKEAMNLLKFHHSNICTYKESFVTWDNKVSCLFLHLVMQHSGQGDLSSRKKGRSRKK
ncbi:serine/threonine kinase-like domain-containing protein STKLD1 isoform X1 [Neopsephotus bourkii]|uniref:serine/threonine kinase-like domain-containing protein STKLD1 isoform X1 n=1 Tax=Neopsephotus bourkii TaxID=309878 RepID=UPI002AA56B65|nr:serine/threonine kinase-like domain-containing protein STKLD1 isoform X1 [Neopsephotus bourkii]